MKKGEGCHLRDPMLTVVALQKSHSLQMQEQSLHLDRAPKKHLKRSKFATEKQQNIFSSLRKFITC